MHAPIPEPVLAVEATDVHRSFGDQPALAGFDLAVPARSVTALLGPNGAGKTTAIRILTGALPVHRGRVRTLGLDPVAEGEAVRRRCGVVSAKPALYDRLSGRDNLAYSAELHGLGRGPAAAAAITGAAARFGIDGALAQKVGGYSTGMKTRLALARAVLHQPDLLLLDEPTSGLDPESAHAVLELVRGLPDEGATVVLCTHLLAEADGLADWVVLLDAGRSVLAGSPAELARRFWPAPVVRIDADDRAALIVVARRLPGVVAVDPTGPTGGPPAVQVDDLARVPALVAALVAAGVRITLVEPHQPTIEDLYFAARRDHRAPPVATDERTLAVS
ncbi:MAG: ABC transporter ATP-binding protein [Acidimicrobiales bacterium]